MHGDGTPGFCSCRLDGLNGTLEVLLGRDEVWIAPMQEQKSAKVQGK